MEGEGGVNLVLGQHHLVAVVVLLLTPRHMVEIVVGLVVGVVVLDLQEMVERGVLAGVVGIWAAPAETAS